jgi:4-hydroxythreonine-4-phosphate dehydrogenase
MRPASRAKLLVVSSGCPAGIGPEVSVRAAAEFEGARVLLVGDERTLLEAAELQRIPAKKLEILQTGEPLKAADRRPGKPTPASGRAQLAYIEAALELARAEPHRALVTGPVSKAAIAHSGLVRARRFLGHTEWLRDLDGAKVSVMCFASARLVTSLATTHVPLARVPKELSPQAVADATAYLGELLLLLGKKSPRIAVASLNPHAGESELLGGEEARAIAPGIAAAGKRLGRRARITGPIGAETAYRKALAGVFDGVVAMYHDQATIPMKVVAFGDAVNVTMGLSIVRTSVDHGTAYDIAWKGKADASGMRAALELAARITR